MPEKVRHVTKVEKYGAEAVVDAVLRGGGTLPQACAAFKKATGEPIGVAAVGRYRKNVILKAMDKTRQTEMLVDRLIQREDIICEGSDPGEAVADLARRMLLVRAVEAVADIPAGDMAALTPDKLAQMIGRLEATRISGERLRLQYDRAYAAARGAIFAQLEAELRDHPGLFQKVRALAEKASAEAFEKSDARKSA